jgi:hypothetical protein
MDTKQRGSDVQSEVEDGDESSEDENVDSRKSRSRRKLPLLPVRYTYALANFLKFIYLIIPFLH